MPMFPVTVLYDVAKLYLFDGFPQKYGVQAKLTEADRTDRRIMLQTWFCFFVNFNADFRPFVTEKLKFNRVILLDRDSGNVRGRGGVLSDADRSLAPQEGQNAPRNNITAQPSLTSHNSGLENPRQENGSPISASQDPLRHFLAMKVGDRNPVSLQPMSAGPHSGANGNH